MDSKDKELAIKKLYAGETVQKVCTFFNIGLSDLNKIAKENGFKNINECIRVKNTNLNKTKGKPRDARILSAAREYIEKGRSFEQFLRDLKASERPFSNEQIELAKSLFVDAKINCNKNKPKENDEIEF